MTDELQPTLAELEDERERELDRYEQHLIGIIEQLGEEFRMAAAPHVKRLAEIRSFRRRIIVMPDGAVLVPFTASPDQEEVSRG